MEEENFEVDVIEFSMSEQEIDEWIDKLQELKQNKNSINLDIDSENELLINYGEENE